MNPLQMLQQVFGNNEESENSDSESATETEDSESTLDGGGDEFSDFSSDDDTRSSFVKNSRIYKFKPYIFQESRPRPGPCPKPRSGHRIVYFNGKIYSFGGFNPAIETHDPAMADDIFWHESRPLFKELWCYNLSSRRWVKCAMKGDIPEQLASHTAVLHPAHRGVMLVYGGTGAPFGLTTSNTVVSCNLSTHDFQPVRVGGAWRPDALYGQAVITDPASSLLFTLGGTSGFHYFMDVDCLDLSSSPRPTWSSLYRQRGRPEEPEPRYRHELALHQGSIYVLGGGTSFSANRFEHLPTFNVKEKKWSYTRTKPDLSARIDNSENGFPEARRCHGCVQLGSSVWLLGGYDGDEVYGDAWCLEMVSMQWSLLPVPLPLPTYFQAVTTTEEGQLVMFGGVDSLEQNTRTDKVFTAWLTIPTLRALAWEAVTFYNPDLDRQDPNYLLAQGIPRDCVDKVTTEVTPEIQADWG